MRAELLTEKREDELEPVRDGVPPHAQVPLTGRPLVDRHLAELLRLAGHLAEELGEEGPPDEVQQAQPAKHNSMSILW